MDKMPMDAYDTSAEIAVIGYAMTFPEAWETVLDQLTDRHFSDELYRDAFVHARQWRADGHTVHTALPEIVRRCTASGHGATVFRLAKAVEAVETHTSTWPPRLKYYLDRLEAAAARRAVAWVGEEALQAATGHENPVDRLISIIQNFDRYFDGAVTNGLLERCPNDLLQEHAE